MVHITMARLYGKITMLKTIKVNELKSEDEKMPPTSDGDEHNASLLNSVTF
jgi:hypothetical protein